MLTTLWYTYLYVILVFNALPTVVPCVLLNKLEVLC
jgi:hypothetical protein